MEELLEQIASACFGLTVEDVAQQLELVPGVPEDKRSVLAAYFVSLAEAA